MSRSFGILRGPVAGQDATATIDGVTYSTKAGMSVAVPDPHVPGLVALGWILDNTVTKSDGSSENRYTQAVLATALPFRDKLRRLAVKAKTNNPLVNPPWTVPGAMTVGTAYSQGDVRSLNGSWWVNMVTGNASSAFTSLLSDPEAVITNTKDGADGTAQWQFFSAPTLAGNDPLAPTITRSTSAPSAPHNIPWKPTSNQAYACYKVYGGYPRADYLPSTGLMVRTFDSAPASPSQCGGKVGFWSDDPKITISTGSTNPSYRISVDGRYLTVSGYTNTAAETHTTIDWTAVGGRKARYYEVEGMSRLSVGVFLTNVYVSAASSVWAPSPDDDVRAMFISDSQLAGSTYSGVVGGGGVAEGVAKYLGWSDPWNMSIGGTGWINTATSYYNFAQRIAEALTRNPDIWVFFGSTNDSATTTALPAAVAAALQLIRAGGSRAPIVVFGILPVAGYAATMEPYLAQGVAGSADPLGKTFFIPLCGATPFPTTIGSFNRPAALNVSVNSFAADINDTDKVHLLQRGVSRYHQLMADLIRTQVYPLLAA